MHLGQLTATVLLFNFAIFKSIISLCPRHEPFGGVILRRIYKQASDRQFADTYLVNYKLIEVIWLFKQCIIPSEDFR